MDELDKKIQKIRLSLLPPLGELEAAKALENGARKYGADVWRFVSKEVFLDAILRHLNALRRGEKFDESGLLHTAHIAANALILAELYAQREPQ